MSAVIVYNTKNEKVGEVELSDKVFGVEVNQHILHEVVRMQRAAKRAGTACTKTRVEVRGGGAKPWRQKGTGRARAGTSRSPIWRGGGVTFGPKPRDYSFKLNRKVKRKALAMAMSARLQEDNLLVLDNFDMDKIKTKDFVNIMNGFDIVNSLIVVDGDNENLVKSSANVNGFKVMKVDGLNVYDVLLHKKLIVVQNALNGLDNRLAA